MSVTDGISKPDRRSASACVACRLSKVKCDLPETGVCIRCTRLGLVCVKEDLQELCVTEAAHELPRAGDRMDKSEENGAQPDIGAKRGETANLCKAFLDKFGAFRGSWKHIESDARQLVDELVSQASDHGAQATAFTLASLRNVLDARLSKKQRKEKNNLTNEQRAVWAQVMTLELIEFTPSKYCQSSSADVHTCATMAVQAEAAAARAEAAAALKESARLSELLEEPNVQPGRVFSSAQALQVPILAPVPPCAVLPPSAVLPPDAAKSPASAPATATSAAALENAAPSSTQLCAPVVIPPASARFAVDPSAVMAPAFAAWPGRPRGFGVFVYALSPPVGFPATLVEGPATRRDTFPPWRRQGVPRAVWRMGSTAGPPPTVLPPPTVMPRDAPPDDAAPDDAVADHAAPYDASDDEAGSDDGASDDDASDDDASPEDHLAQPEPGPLLPLMQSILMKSMAPTADAIFKSASSVAMAHALAAQEVDALSAAETHQGALEQMALASVGACAGDALSVAHPGDALSVAHPMQSIDSSALRLRVLRPLPPPPLLEASLIGLPPWLQ